MFENPRRGRQARNSSLRKHPFLLALRRWGSFARNASSGQERGETNVLAGYNDVPKILDLKSCSEQIFSENSRWVPLADAGLYMSQTKINAMMHNFSCMTEMHIFPLLNL